MRLPFVRDYWIGSTYVDQFDSGSSEIALPANSELRELTSEDLREIADSPDPKLRGRQGAPNTGAVRYGAWLAGRLVGVCTFSFGPRYHGYYALRQDEAELADIFTAASARGQGIATALIRYGTRDMHRRGFSTLYAKIWRKNLPSLTAFQKSGWRRHCLFVRIETKGGRVLYAQWPPSMTFGR